MIERLRTPVADRVLISPDSLADVVTAILQTRGLSQADAAEAATVLVSADLRGVETHGVSNVVRAYLKAYDDGALNPTPMASIVHETASAAVIDGDHGLGITQGRRAMDLAVEKAKATGVGVVTMRNSGHLGAVGHFALQAARQNAVGLCMTAAGMSVLPPLGSEPRIGTNPIAVAAPTSEGPFFLYDAATSAIADNKIKIAARLGAKLAPGWIADERGEPVLEECAIPDGRFFMVPTGSSSQFGSHKGFGLGLVVEILCAMLSGGGPAMLRNTKSYSGEYKHHFAAYDIASFVDVDWFKSTMTEMLHTVEETPPVTEPAVVRFPGLRSAEEYERRRRDGVPLHREVVEWLDEFTRANGLTPLERASGSR